jgi:hypothetical protein
VELPGSPIRWNVVVPAASITAIFPLTPKKNSLSPRDRPDSLKPYLSFLSSLPSISCPWRRAAAALGSLAAMCFWMASVPFCGQSGMDLYTVTIWMTSMLVGWNLFYLWCYILCLLWFYIYTADCWKYNEVLLKFWINVVVNKNNLHVEGCWQVTKVEVNSPFITKRWAETNTSHSIPLFLVSAEHKMEPFHYTHLSQPNTRMEPSHSSGMEPSYSIPLRDTKWTHP